MFTEIIKTKAKLLKIKILIQEYFGEDSKNK